MDQNVYVLKHVGAPVGHDAPFVFRTVLERREKMQSE